MARTAGFLREPLALLLDAYERFGPVFTMRVFHHNVVYLLGPEANHHILVANAENFSWREGHLGDLMPLLGDGLLTVDGAFHRTSRRIMLPAFHRERIAAAQELMEREVERALAAWRPGTRSASPPGGGRSSPKARTCPSAAARGCAWGCGSVRPRSGSSRGGSSRRSDSSSFRATCCASARRRRWVPATACR